MEVVSLENDTVFCMSKVRMYLSQEAKLWSSLRDCFPCSALVKFIVRLTMTSLFLLRFYYN